MICAEVDKKSVKFGGYMRREIYFNYIKSTIPHHSYSENHFTMRMSTEIMKNVWAVFKKNCIVSTELGGVRLHNIIPLFTCIIYLSVYT